MKNVAVKIPKFKLIQAIYKAISGEVVLKESFPVKLRVVNFNKNRLIFKQGENLELLPVSKCELINYICDFCESLSDIDSRYFVKPKEAIEIIDGWKYRGKALDVRNHVLFKDQLGYCFHRVPFQPKPGETPTWDSVTCRMTNADAFMMFIASMFHSGSYNQQYIWIYGEGGEGKGSIGRWLNKIFGQSFISLSTIPKSQFWKAALVGKRCVVFSDWSNACFVTGGEFKGMVGGDIQQIEEKYERPYKTYLNNKYIFFSNEKPYIASEASDLRRLIYCHIDPIDESKKEYDAFESKLWDESAAFLHRCFELYAANCPNHQPIPFNHTQTIELAAENESEYEGLLQGSFKEEKNGVVLSKDMVDWYRRRNLSWREKVEWKKFLLRRGVKYTAIRLNGQVSKAFTGISFISDYATRDAESLCD